MKRIEAITRPDKVQAVKRALIDDALSTAICSQRARFSAHMCASPSLRMSVNMSHCTSVPTPTQCSMGCRRAQRCTEADTPSCHDCSRATWRHQPPCGHLPGDPVVHTYYQGYAGTVAAG